MEFHLCPFVPIFARAHLYLFWHLPLRVGINGAPLKLGLANSVTPVDLNANMLLWSVEASVYREKSRNLLFSAINREIFN